MPGGLYQTCQLRSDVAINQDALLLNPRAWGRLVSVVPCPGLHAPREGGALWNPMFSLYAEQKITIIHLPGGLSEENLFGNNY